LIFFWRAATSASTLLTVSKSVPPIIPTENWANPNTSELISKVCQMEGAEKKAKHPLRGLFL